MAATVSGQQLRYRSAHRRLFPTPLSADVPPRPPNPEREYGHRKGLCKAEDCSQAEIARGFCFRHYQQVRRYGRLTPERERIYSRTTCQVTDCHERHAARGYCKKHYMQEFYLPRQAVQLELTVEVA